MIEIKNNTLKKTFDYTEKIIKEKVNEGVPSDYKEGYPSADNLTLLKDEVFWLNHMKSKWVPELLEVNEKELYVITSYYGPDLIQSKIMPSVEQVIEMYEFFKEKNVYKLNNALSNLTMNGNQLVAFDWKWAKFREDKYKEYELLSYDRWMSKIDTELVEKLKCMI